MISSIGNQSGAAASQGAQLSVSKPAAAKSASPPPPPTAAAMGQLGPSTYQSRKIAYKTEQQVLNILA